MFLPQTAHFQDDAPRSSPGAETRTRRPIANRPRPTSQPTPAHCALWRRPAPGHPPPKGRVPKTASSVEWSLQALKQACSQEYPESAMCVQSLDDSLDSAIRITYRISLRSSSLREPRHPPLKVFLEVLSLYMYRYVCGLSLAVHAQNARLTSDDTHTHHL